MTNSTTLGCGSGRGKLRQLSELLVLAFLVAVPITYVNGRLWILELASHFRAHYFAASVLLLVCILVLAKRRRLVLAALVSTGLQAAFLLPSLFSETGNSGAALAGNVVQDDAPIHRAVAYNMFFRNDDATNVVAAIRGANSDIVALSELNAVGMQAVEQLSGEFPHRVLLPSDQPFGIGLLSKVPFEACETRVFAPNLPLPTILCIVRFEDKLATVIATHLMSPVSPRYLAERNEHLVAMGKFIANTGRPAFLLGDFNLTPHSPFFQDFVNSSGLSAGPAHGLLGATWPSWLGPFGISIDHLFVSRHFAIVSRKVGSPFGSDHRLVEFEFRLRRSS